MRSILPASVLRLVDEEDGQDLIEYALLTAIITVGSIVVFGSIQTKIGNAYTYWQDQGQVNWIPMDPTVPIP